jgi:nucleoside-triphosphatase THEP1
MPVYNLKYSNYFLTGKPGAGKTTLITKIAEGISGHSVGGFYTREIREHGARVGFRVDTFDGQSGVLSHMYFHEGPRVGKYTVDIDAFERIGVSALERAVLYSDIILIDEIGRMELFSIRFRHAVLDALDSDKPVIATIMSRSHPFADSLKKRQDSYLLTVTDRNRNTLATKFLQKINY